MTSSRKIESNKKNASWSTGPRSLGGKLRSRMNARRHGLATQLRDIPEQADRLEQLATILAEGKNNLLATEELQLIAECHIDMQRIRAAQHGLLHQIITAESEEDLKSSLSAVEKIDRYRRRAVSKRKKSLKILFQEFNQ